ncbi:hypothetical protein Pla8534_64270 [Lignipirellula cremea]|uniref:Uncharacterized protein n=1 Tax=Lignipirellula cremea TaxID=2528010 RepID=A0A518E392_9BACT|nr:hypothetical protein Pla8534_64270 [Lignipirellula cremea]
MLKRHSPKQSIVQKTPVSAPRPPNSPGPAECAFAVQFPDLASYPDSVQEAIVDMVYNVGNVQGKFPNFTKAVKKRDWETALKESNRIGVGERRNRVTRELFERAVRQEEVDGDWPDSAFPTTYSVSSYRTDVPTVGLLEGVTSNLAEAQQWAAQLRSSKYVAAVEVVVDPGSNDSFPAEAETLVQAVKENPKSRYKSDDENINAIANEYRKLNRLPEGKPPSDMRKFFESETARQEGWTSPPKDGPLDPVDWAKKSANRGDLVVAYPPEADLPMFVVFPSRGLGWNAVTGPVLTNQEKGARQVSLRAVTDVIDQAHFPKYRFARLANPGNRNP